MKTKVLSVFPLCGKTFLFNNQDAYEIKVLDSDSSKFSWIEDDDGKTRNPEFPQNYIKHIKEAIDSGEYDYILVSTHKVVRSAMEEAGIEFTVVYPERQLLTEWVGRWFLRKENGFDYEVLINNWEEWIDDLSEYPAYNKIILESDQYLSDVIDCDLNEIDLESIAYGRYQIMWMVEHGYTLNDMLNSFEFYYHPSHNIDDDFQNWINDGGFNGEIWASKDEFLKNEYRRISYMVRILSSKEMKIYRDKLGRMKRMSEEEICGRMIEDD